MTRNSINNTSSDLTVSDIEISGSTIATLPTNANLLFAPNGTGNVFINRLSFNNGIDYLNFYTVQTFTPIVNYQTGGSSGITYALQQGIKIRFGSFYFISSNIILTNKGTATLGDSAIVTNGGMGISTFTTVNYVPCIVKNVNYTLTFAGATELKYNLNNAYFSLTYSGSPSITQWLRYRDINNNSEFYWSGIFVITNAPT